MQELPPRSVFQQRFTFRGKQHLDTKNVTLSVMKSSEIPSIYLRIARETTAALGGVVFLIHVARLVALSISLGKSTRVMLL